MEDGTPRPEELADALAQQPDQESTLPWVSTGTLPSDEDVHAIVEAGYERFRDVSEGEVADYIPALAEASPITHVNRDAPPFLLIHGDKDESVPYSESTNLQRALLAAGVLTVNEVRAMRGLAPMPGGAIPRTTLQNAEEAGRAVLMQPDEQ